MNSLLSAKFLCFFLIKTSISTSTLVELNMNFILFLGHSSLLPQAGGHSCSYHYQFCTFVRIIHFIVNCVQVFKLAAWAASTYLHKWNRKQKPVFMEGVKQIPRRGSLIYRRSTDHFQSFTREVKALSFTLDGHVVPVMLPWPFLCIYMSPLGTVWQWTIDILDGGPIIASCLNYSVI